MRLGTQFLARLCRLPKQEFKIQTTIETIETTFVTMYFVSRRSLLYSIVSIVVFNHLSCHANIVQRVKSCYKIKIDFRDFASRFLCFLLHLWRPDLSIQPLLHSNSNAIRVKKRLYCMIIEAVLECKRGSIVTQRCLFCFVIHCTLSFLIA